VTTTVKCTSARAIPGREDLEALGSDSTEVNRTAKIAGQSPDQGATSSYELASLSDPEP
jgi:hypothetical protein